jgi:Flp pilus assembly protein TadD
MNRRGTLRGLFRIGMIALVVAGGCTSHLSSTPEAEAPPVDSAEAQFESSAKRPPTAQTLYSLAEILALQGKDHQAQLVFTSIIRQYPRIMPAYCGLAQTQMRLRLNRDAIDTLRMALKISPRESILINDLGMCQLLGNNPVAALQTFTRAAALSPDEPRYRANMAVALGLQGRYREALSLYLEIMPPADAHANVALLCDSEGDVAQAAEQRKLARKLESDIKTASAASAMPGDAVQTP